MTTEERTALIDLITDVLEKRGKESEAYKGGIDETETGTPSQPDGLNGGRKDGRGSCERTKAKRTLQRRGAEQPARPITSR